MVYWATSTSNVSLEPARLSTVNRPTIDNNHVDGALYVDIGGSFEVLPGATAYFKVDNVLRRGAESCAEFRQPRAVRHARSCVSTRHALRAWSLASQECCRRLQPSRPIR